MRIYLAGPEVFLPDAAAVGAAKKRICEAHGLVGLFPLDGEAPALEAELGSRRIFDANLRLIRRADALIANLTPFRGVGADPGTVFEVGVAFALCKPVFGYTNRGGDLMTRVLGHVPGEAAPHVDDGRLYAGDGIAVEDFGLSENLMLVEALRACGEDLIVVPDPADPWRDLRGFEACVRRAGLRLAAA